MKRIPGRAAALLVATVTAVAAPQAVAAHATQAGFTPAKLPVSGAVLSSGVQLDRHTTWAAGFRITGSDQRLRFAPVVLSHDDRSEQWTELPAPAPDYDGRATAVAGSSTNDAWLFGDREPNTGRILAQHWDGKGWTATRIEPPEGELNGAYLLGASAPRRNSAWAVGGATVVTKRTPDPDHGGTVIETRTTGLIEHWDGTAWHRQSVAGIDGDWWLSSVTEISGNDVWAVGNTAAPEDKPVLLHYDGRTWTRVAAPAFTGLYGEYQGVAAAGPDDVWVVGRAVLADKDRGHPLVAHYDGRSWSTVPAPDGVAGKLWSVTAVPGGMAAVGWDPSGADDRPLGLRYTNGRWQSLDLSVDGYQNTSYQSVVAARGGRLTAIGAGGTSKSPDYQPLIVTGH
ncbi:hypothetical protein [Kitasatospora sp. NPDC097643]|uniref:hypothetical protein n=1 Tax=Kitasatospora sp. NPDC097643 TaxID=3157230 RepID=UPI0033210F78